MHGLKFGHLRCWRRVHGTVLRTCSCRTAADTQKKMLARIDDGTRIGCDGQGRGLTTGLCAVGLALLAAERYYDDKHFFKAAIMGDIDEIKKQVRGPGEGEGGVDRRHALGWTALMAAAANAQAGAVAELLRLGARPEARERYAGAGAAARAAGLHPLDALQQREDEFGASLNARASFLDWTALHYAALADSAEAADALLRAGADPTARDHAGRRPQHYARPHSPAHRLLRDSTDQWERAAEAAAAEERRRFPLEQRLKQRIVGQTAAIRTVAAAVRRKENGWADEEHPLVLLFLGSSGIGKTELAKQLAHYLYRDDPAAFIRLDMSEYQEKHEVAKLIGAPPGYVGHEEGGQLTRALAARGAGAVVLLDEVDKAHPDVLTVLLQLFDEGRLTDGKGKLIECKNAIFVMTSNLAADEIAHYGLRLRREQELAALPPPAADRARDGEGAGGEAEAEDEEPPQVSRQFKEAVVRPILKRHFRRDEFLGRIDEVVYFLPFSRQELLTLVGCELARWAEAARARHGLRLEWEAGVLGVLADGYDVHYGARSIHHEVQRRVVSLLAEAGERAQLPRGAAVLLAERAGRLALLVRAPGRAHYEELPPDAPAPAAPAPAPAAPAPAGD